MSVSEGDQAAYVRQTHYGLDEIEYSVSLARPLLMVENETYFPGWTATLISEGRGSVIQAIPADGIFRAWNLPAGNYRMIARFNLPGTAWYRGVSIAALAVWLLLFLREGIRRTNVWQRIRPQVLS